MAFISALLLSPLILSLEQSGPVVWSFSGHVNADGKVEVELTAGIDEPWHMYATWLPADDGPLPTVIRFNRSGSFTLFGDLVEPEPIEAYDPNFAMLVRHHSGTTRFTQAIHPLTQGTFTVEGEVEYMVCDDKTCLPPTVVPFSITISRIEQ